MTQLKNAELALLVRLDGQQSLAEVRRAMPHVSAHDFALAFRNLRDRRLLAEAVPRDAFDMKLQCSLDSFNAAVGGTQVDTGLFSLRQAGYYCGIARSRTAGAPARPVGSRLNALVVEDEPVLAKFVQSYLQFEGIQSRVAANRAEVCAELSRHPVPDLLLLDVMLPDADGFDILRRVRTHAMLKEVPVIMLTGKATREAVLEGMEAGADGYVTKPFDAEALMRAVRTVLDLPLPTPTTDPWLNADAKPARAAACMN